jgi:antitoxin CcdA
MRNIQSKRRPVNLSIDGDMIAEAKTLGVNVSRACETGLAAELKRARGERWAAENREAIEATNRWIEKHGLPLEDLRLF